MQFLSLRRQLYLYDQDSVEQRLVAAKTEAFHLVFVDMEGMWLV
jgi:hypothetical protein